MACLVEAASTGSRDYPAGYKSNIFMIDVPRRTQVLISNGSKLEAHSFIDQYLLAALQPPPVMTNGPPFP
jgi:hypothetical protein